MELSKGIADVLVIVALYVYIVYILSKCKIVEKSLFHSENCFSAEIVYVHYEIVTFTLFYI